jgi:hypothetical protein
VPSAALASSPPLKTILSAAQQSVDHQKSVVVKVVTKQGKKVEGRVTASIGNKVGRESIVSGPDKVKILLTTKESYIQGNSLGLQAFLGLTALQASKVGSKWIAALPGSTMFTNVQRSLDITSFRSVIPPAKGLTLSMGSVHRTAAYKLTWITKATSTTPITASSIYLAVGGNKLPLLETEQNVDGESSTSFQRWSKSIRVSAPLASDTYPDTKL